MPFAVVLDTCVLYPAHLRDTLLRLAERDLYRPLWSADIVEELRRNLSVIAPGAIDHLVDQMATAFPEAEVDGYRSLIDGLTCDPKDRHVLAAAIRADADAIVTFNVDDFPEVSLAPFGVEALHPDAFLLDLLDLAPGLVLGALADQAAANRRAPRTVADLLDALTRAGATAFADEVRRRVG